MSQSLEMIGRRAETRVSCQITPCQFVLFPFAAAASCGRNRKNQAVTHPSQPSYYQMRSIGLLLTHHKHTHNRTVYFIRHILLSYETRLISQARLLCCAAANTHQSRAIGNGRREFPLCTQTRRQEIETACHIKEKKERTKKLINSQSVVPLFISLCNMHTITRVNMNTDCGCRLR